MSEGKNGELRGKKMKYLKSVKKGDQLLDIKFSLILYIKGDLLCPSLQDLRFPQNVSVKIQLKILHRWFIISFWKCLFWVVAEHAVFMHVSLNANELLLPAPFSRIGLCLYSWHLRYSAKKHLFGFDYHAYCAEIMCFKAILV